MRRKANFPPVQTVQIPGEAPHVRFRDRVPDDCRAEKLRKSHFRSLTGIPEILMQVPTMRKARKN